MITGKFNLALQFNELLPKIAVHIKLIYLATSRLSFGLTRKIPWVLKKMVDNYRFGSQEVVNQLP